MLDAGGSKASTAYNTVMVVAIAVSIVPLCVRESNSLLVALDVVSCFIFVIDYLLRWYACDMAPRHSRLMSRVLYPLTPMAIIDLLSIVPTLGLFSSTFKLLRFTRLIRILRIFKFIRYYKPMRVMGAVVAREGKTLLTVFGFAIFYVFVTALIMFNSEKPVDPETGKYVFGTFFDALYWAACTLTTVGYGDICPVSGLGRLISMISAMVGVAIIALPSGVITASYLEELKKSNKKKGNKEKN